MRLRLRRLLSAARPACLALLVTSGGALGQEQQGVLPDWLIGTWKAVDVYYPDNLTGTDRGGLGFLLDRKFAFTFHPTEFTYDTHITPGGGSALDVEEWSMPFSDVFGTGTAKDDRRRRLDLRKLPISLYVRPQKCYMDDDERGKDDSPFDVCTAFLAARSPDPKRVFLYFFQKQPDNPLAKALVEYQRLGP